jgi:AcrR family transcriptional regulator
MSKPMSTTTPTTTPRPLRADARRNRERLLTIAGEAFAEHGLDASLEEIARRAGVGVGTLYRHFPSRNALVEALIREDSDALCLRGDELAADTDPVAALTTWLAALVEHAGRFRGLAQSLTVGSAGDGHDDDPLADCCHAVQATGERLVERVRRAGRLRDDVTSTDVLDLAASVAWICEQAPRDGAQRERLLSMVLTAAVTPRRRPR